MPRKPKTKVNKSETIRQYVAANPKATAKEIHEAVAKQGVKVSLMLVYNNLRPKKRRGRKPASTGEVSLDSMIAAKKLVTHVGSVQEAKRMLDAVAKLI